MDRIEQDVYMDNLDKTVGFGYWLGTYGQIATRKLWASKSAQYPDWYDSKSHQDEYDRWLGKRVSDCIGLDKWCRWLQPDGNPKYDLETDLNQEMLFALAKELGMEWGKIENVPNVPGLCVWKRGHIGFILRNGKVRESRGGDYGVIDRPLSDGPWTHYFYNPFIDYDAKAQNFKVTCSALYIRTGPGTSFDVTKATKKVAYRTEILRVTEIRGSWGRHQLGWSNISSKYVEPANEVATYEVTCRMLNVRSGPGTQNDVLNAVTHGTILHVVELVGNWGRHQLGWSNISQAFCKSLAVQQAQPIEDYSNWPVLRYGQSNAYVKRMQLNLILRGYKIPSGATGNYLNETEKAVLAFLKDESLISSRVTSARNIYWGQRCWKALLG